MENKLRLTKDSCEDIGFVKSCLFIGAITKSEFQDWISFIIEHNSVDVLPLYIFDLIDFNGDFSEFSKIIGFVPFSGLSDEEMDALYGIVIKRFSSFFDMPISEKQAIKYLDDNPQVLEQFRNMFPFIKLEF